MFRMNGISRVSTWMCGAIVSNLHSLQFDVRRDCVRFARLVVVGWITRYPRVFPVESQRCVTNNAPYGGGFPCWCKRCVTNNAPYGGGFPCWCKRCVTNNAPYGGGFPCWCKRCVMNNARGVNRRVMNYVPNDGGALFATLPIFEVQHAE